MTFTDTHAHIYVKEFDADRSDMLARAQSAGVRKMYMPNIDADSIDLVLETASRNPSVCIPVMGLHPCSVKRDFERGLQRPFEDAGF